jgi:hypothetical protein
MKNKDKILSLVDDLIAGESYKDSLEKEKDKTLSGDSWTLFHLKILKSLILEDDSN